MKRPPIPESLAGERDRAWRDPAQIVGSWSGAREPEPALLEHTVHGAWWELLAARELTLLITREYEHFVLGLGVSDGRPEISYLALPHPSGLATDLARKRVYVAATRNPNQIVELKPQSGVLSRLDADSAAPEGRPLLPVATRFYPGCLYLHDLALIGGRLHGNAVGHNAVVSFEAGNYERVWWPRSIDADDGPIFGQNHLQLNSIAAGEGLEDSFFSASADRVSSRRPGDPGFEVDRRGVIFSGRTREVVAGGLTRPHSARLHHGRLWVDNSGYGELGRVESGVFEPRARLPGWTRGLCFHGDVAFVGTSRILPRFEHYAPGLDADACVCGVHAVDTDSGKILGAIEWPAGNQIFAVEAVPRSFSRGLPFSVTDDRRDPVALFYSFEVENHR